MLLRALSPPFKHPPSHHEQFHSIKTIFTFMETHYHEQFYITEMIFYVHGDQVPIFELVDGWRTRDQNVRTLSHRPPRRLAER